MNETNPQLELAQHFIHYTGMNLFLTGKAGTGKTTFLRNLRLHSPKRMIVLAPTGVAAINAGGVTIHSFSNFPLRHIYLVHSLPPVPVVNRWKISSAVKNQYHAQSRSARNR